MSQRIEKGGTRFKPSIVPRRTAGAAAAGTSTPAPPAPSAAAAGASPAVAAPRRPSLAAASPSPVLRATASSIQSSPSLRPNQPPPIGGPRPLSSGGKSFAVAPSPSRIIVPGRASNASSPSLGPSASNHTPFQRPAISRQAPGSRTSVTPSPSGSRLRTPSIPPLPAGDLGGYVGTAAPAASTSTTAATAATAAAPPKKKPFSISVGSNRRAVDSDASADGSAALAAVGPSSTADKQSFSTRNAGEMPPPSAAATRERRESVMAASSIPSAAGTERDGPAAEQAETGSLGGSAANAKGKGRVVDDAPEPSRPRRKTASQQQRKATATAAAAEADDDDDSGSGNDFDDDDDDDSSEEEEEPDEVRKARAAKRAASRQKRRLKRAEEASGKPRRPQSAYLLFMGAMRQQRRDELSSTPLTQATALLAEEWRRLGAEDRKQWEDKATEARKEYELKLAEWSQAHPNGVEMGESDESGWETTSEVDDEGNRVRRRKAKSGGRSGSRKARTISDDEREYFEQIETEGPGLPSSRLDASSTSMSDLSVPDLKRGRAGPRTFELERVRRRQAEERKTALKEAAEQLEERKRLGISGTSFAAPTFGMGGPSGSSNADADGGGKRSNGNEIIEGEEEVDDDDDDDDDEEGDGASGAGPSGSSRRSARRAPSVAGTEHSFTENRFAVQTRIVDGKIVVDETSLFANYGNGEEDREGMEVVDEREGDRFVNSATRGKAFGRYKRWSDDDNAKFYWAIRQWGTDFEMISRLFPGRDRGMIKKKWNIEERANPKKIDDALNNRLAIDIDAYAQAANIDFSGPMPEISATLGDWAAALEADEAAANVKKREGTAPESGSRTGRGNNDDDDDDDDWEYEEVIEIDDDGTETVTRKRIGRKGGLSGKRRKTSRKPSLSQAAPAEAMPPPPAAADEAAARPPSIGAGSQKSGRVRGNSVASSHATSGGGGGGSGAGGSRRMSRSDASTAAAMERERKHRASELRGSEAPTERMEVEEIVGDA
ncbi:uncharacterized protein PSFLO_07016 [Pseudozyma flocculosa]|uniref:HMG box domain-containing protein n=1 Tax=Pseudozyma flocculosa TaxID=84751 RepID=A0A5C3FAQ4_9BASI|nr:uncharacterized protein PSFLO_07016 [Pseudozyma flocculosa]